MQSYGSVVLLNSAASSEQIDPNTNDTNVRQGISGEWVKVVQAPGMFFFPNRIKYE